MSSVMNSYIGISIKIEISIHNGFKFAQRELKKGIDWNYFALQLFHFD